MTDGSADAVVVALAAAFLDGPWTPEGLTHRGRAAVGSPRAGWVAKVAAAVLAQFHRPPHDAPRELHACILGSTAYGSAKRAAARRGVPLRMAHLAVGTTRMRGNRFGVPELHTVLDVAEFLEVAPEHLDWFADLRRHQVRAAGRALHHYRSAWTAKRGVPRLLEAPKPRLKHLQRRVLHEILDRVPAHDVAHGFVPGRSALTGAWDHVQARTVARFDLEGFFASIPASRVYGRFRLMGYAEPVAHVLTGLTTHVTPLTVLRTMPDGGAADARFRLRRNLSQAHLPQGAPTSPALANLCAHAVDRRLDGLARAVGATFTRYADDLTFSSTAGLDPTALARSVSRIVADEGFVLNPAKTRTRGRGARQLVTGLVVNDHPNVPRDEFDRLKAVLHNCVVHGAASQNRAAHPDFRAHLEGRVSRVEFVNPAKGQRLRRSFERIPW
jgi:RNA-directed DNA polymerase